MIVTFLYRPSAVLGADICQNSDLLHWACRMSIALSLEVTKRSLIFLILNLLELDFMVQLAIPRNFQLLSKGNRDELLQKSVNFNELN